MEDGGGKIAENKSEEGGGKRKDRGVKMDGERCQAQAE